MSPEELWRFLPLGYVVTVMIEAPVLVLGLSRRFGRRERLLAGFWLTACTYPVVVLVLPGVVWSRYGYGAYLAAAETFAPAAECVLLWLAYRDRGAIDRTWMRDWAIVVVANLLSFGAGVWLGPWLMGLMGIRS